MRVLVAVALAACSADSTDVVGPFTGELHRFAVDRLSVPRDSSEAAALAADLDGDGAPENQLGNVTGVLATTNDLSPHGPDMIAANMIASYVHVEADDLTADPSVGVTYFGTEYVDAGVAGGALVGGTFVSNRTRDTRAPGFAVVFLPVFVNADPTELLVYGAEIELVLDGSGGYDGVLRGAVYEDEARQAAHLGLVEMFETEPERHLVFARTIDTNHDDVISIEEVNDSVIALLVTADVDLFDGSRYAPRVTTTPDMLSVAFGFHLSPCPTGQCAEGTPANTCRDRRRDGDETDVDCGGSCQPCWARKQCGRPEDCQSRACSTGLCADATCSDGVRDGYESDVDCGGSCGKCAAGRVCAADSDCASNACDNGVASLGVCAAS